jgi:hypothetical protein
VAVSPTSPSKRQSHAVRFAPLILAGVVFWLMTVSQACCHELFAAPQADKTIIGHVHADDGHPLGSQHNPGTNDETPSCPQLTNLDASVVSLFAAPAPAAAAPVPPVPCFYTHTVLITSAAPPDMRGRPPPALPVYLQTTRLRI